METLFSWLQFLGEQKIVCTTCSSQKDRICSMPNFDFIFILGSTNFQVSALTDHTTQADVTTKQFVKKNMKNLL